MGPGMLGVRAAVVTCDPNFVWWMLPVRCWRNGGAEYGALCEWSGCPTAGVFCCSPFKRWESWGQVTALVPRDEANQVLALSAEVPALLRVVEILDLRRVGKSEDPFVRLGVGEADLFRNALTLGMKKDPETVIPALEKVSRGRGPLSDWRAEIEHFAIHRVDRVSFGGTGLPEQPPLPRCASWARVAFLLPGKAPLRAPSRQRHNDGACDSRSVIMREPRHETGLFYVRVGIGKQLGYPGSSGTGGDSGKAGASLPPGGRE